MNDKSSANITIIDKDAASRKQLLALLARENITGIAVLAEMPGDGGLCLWLGEKGEEKPVGLNAGENNSFIKPVRAGALLDRVRRLQAAGQNAGKRIKIGPFELDVHSSELLLAEDRAVRLTDKEKEILVLLSEAGGAAVDRQALLEKVWGYAPGLETHTLETHIYRLRQKIERDPAKPDILLTDGAGYKIT
ncbi:MAG: response regulator transcription factor [Alphaproteobacteria bacterium]